MSPVAAAARYQIYPHHGRVFVNFKREQEQSKGSDYKGYRTKFVPSNLVCRLTK